MTTPAKQISLRLARSDDISAILSWLNSSSLLSATRLTAFSEVQISSSKTVLRNLIDEKRCLIAVCDNIRIAAVVSQGETLDDCSTCPVWYVPRLQSGWISRMDEVLNEARKTAPRSWRNGRLDPACTMLVSEVPKEVLVPATKYNVVGRRILLLGPAERNRIPIEALEARGYEVHIGRHHNEIYSRGPFDLVVCGGYHLRIPKPICDEFRGRIINIHAGCLPWARGIGLTLFSVLLEYPVGTSIHLIDSELDTGDLLTENRMHMQPGETLRTLYTRMLNDVNNLFVAFLDLLVSGQAVRVPQREVDPRAYSRTRTEFENVLEVCPNGYDTQIEEIEALGKAMRCTVAFRNHLSAAVATRVQDESE